MTNLFVLFWELLGTDNQVSALIAFPGRVLLVVLTPTSVSTNAFSQGICSVSPSPGAVGMGDGIAEGPHGHGVTWLMHTLLVSSERGV